jgi:hypothetical protein
MAFKSAKRREYTQGDSFSPSTNKDIPLLVQVVEFTGPIETFYTKKNDEDPKPAVKVHVVEADPKARRPEVSWNVLWFDQHHDVLERMIDEGDIEIGDTILLRFEDVKKKRERGTYVSIVEPTEDDEADAEEFEEAFGDVFADGPPKLEKAERPGSGRTADRQRPSVRKRNAEPDEDERPARSSRREAAAPARRERERPAARIRAAEPDPDEEAIFDK